MLTKQNSKIIFQSKNKFKVSKLAVGNNETKNVENYSGMLNKTPQSTNEVASKIY